MEYKIMSFNIMRDDIHELSPLMHLHWKYREAMILEVIRDVNPDILAIQEARDLLHSLFQLFADKLYALGYSSSFHHNSENPKLRVVTFWKASKFMCIESRTFWLNPQYKNHRPAIEWIPQGVYRPPRPVGFDVLQTIPFSTSSLRSKPLSLRVYNTHFGHSQLERDKSVDLMRTIMYENTGDSIHNPSVMMADCNFFEKLGGLEQRKRLCDFYNTDYRLDDLTYYASLAQSIPHQLEKNRPTYGTFIGSSIDQFKPLLGKIGDPLDIIVGHGICRYQSQIWNKLPSSQIVPLKPFARNDLEDLYGSDHFPLISTIMM